MGTGISGFDAISGGGLPRGGVTVVIGGAGAGKTIFGMQVLSCSDEPGILVAFEETGERIRANVGSFTWAAAAAAVVVLDAKLSQSVEQSGEFDLQGLLAMVAAKAKQTGAKRVVFDGLDVMLDILGDSALIRREMFRLRDWVAASGMTVIITAKLESQGHAPAHYDFLEFMADCVVSLHHRLLQGTALRFLRVAKYRGVAHSANELPFVITEDGIELAGNTGIELVYPASIERVSTGIERFDAMLCGGYHRGSSVLITGAPGTAKSSIAACFAEAAARRGERTLYVSLDEAPDQIVRNAVSIGIELRPHLDSGALRLYSLRGHAESPATQVSRIRALVRTFKPRNLVIDPISALAQLGIDVLEDSGPLQILDLAKSAGITVVNTSLLGNTMPLAEHTPFGISTIADTWIHVSYVSQGGERNRALTIIKSRGTGHSNQVRELVLTNAGVTLTDVYAVGGEVLMGTLRWEKENETRRVQKADRQLAQLRRQKTELALAEMTAQQDTLSRARAIQEAELSQIDADLLTERDESATEVDELLARRRADTSASDLESTVVR